MPKVKWGGDLTPDDVDSAESRRGDDYAGDVPPSGIYRFKLRWSKKGKSEQNNPKLTSLLVLDGSWKPEHKKYDGCPFWDHMPVTKKTAFRVRQYCDALNITSADFMGKMVIDDEGNVQKIGKLKIADEDLLVYLKVTREDNDDYGPRLVFGKSGSYLPFKEDDDEADEADDAEDGDDEDSEEEPPF